MPAIRTERKSNRLDPLDRPQDMGPLPKAPDTIDGLIRGLQFKSQYTEPMEEEFTSDDSPPVHRPTDPRPPPLALEDIECVKALGAGAYGQVILVRTCRTEHPLDRPGSLFAMKVLRKKIIRQDEAEQADRKNTERSRLEELPWSPFVNGVVQAFHDDINLYLMLEFIPSGTLRSLIQSRGPFDAATAAFYFSNIVCGLRFLEEHHVLHRDLKPENILVGADGYLCLADFGVAHKLYNTEMSDWIMIGTPAYMAPELADGLAKRAYKAVDWWSAGIILFEMTTRKLPFFGRSSGSIYKKVNVGRYTWPPTVRVGKTLKALVAALLTKDATKRIGFRGATEVMAHPWLKHVDFNRVERRKYLAPYVPKEPHPEHTWHREPLPRQDRLPGLKIVPPLPHLQFDRRFPQKVPL
ncbi:cAMP-dependent protein kinase catalytic subunit PRKX [Hypsizygus marmoreus]|uniref:cAMP-dependent protein kinase n=1 Tax=Hypsizygus marmoreus TaxID=39966 RepID=A0A369JK01_HYPMA|nr:cAMP-dependent protein kinase catalytic subunit PRKX [Hypsizygus marmoreus]